MSAKLVLDIAAMQEEFFEDTALIGIVSALPIYRFCWMLNHQMDMNLNREPELDICLQKNASKQHYFPIYQYLIPLSGCRHLLYKLKSDKEALLPEVKQLDYLWMIQSPTAEEQAETYMNKLRTVPDVQLAQVLDTYKLKHLDHLLV